MPAGAAAGIAVPAAPGDRLLFCMVRAGPIAGPGLRALSAAAIGAEALTACRFPFERAGAGAGAGRAELLDSANGEGSPGTGAEALLLARVGA